MSARPERGWRAALAPWLVPLGILALWQLAAQAGWLSSRILPAPSAVAAAAGRWPCRASCGCICASALRALWGLLLGGGLGLALGLLNGASRRAETLLDTTLQMIRNIPVLALIPLFILWFGIEETAKLALLSVGVFFPVYLNTFHGIRSVDPALIEMGRSYGLSGWRLYRDVILPGALPSMLVGLRFALGRWWC